MRIIGTELNSLIDFVCVFVFLVGLTGIREACLYITKEWELQSEETICW